MSTWERFMLAIHLVPVPVGIDPRETEADAKFDRALRELKSSTEELKILSSERPRPANSLEELEGRIRDQDHLMRTALDSVHE